MLPEGISKIKGTNMLQTIIWYIWTIHADWMWVISSVIHIHEDGLFTSKLLKQLLHKWLNIEDSTKIPAGQQWERWKRFLLVFYLFYMF